MVRALGSGCTTRAAEPVIPRGSIRRATHERVSVSMYVLLFLAAFVAFMLSAISGGGASLLVIPLLQRVVPISAVPAALSIGTGSSSVSRIAAFHRDIRWDVAVWFVPAAIPAAVLGAASLRFLNPTYVQLLMAVFLIGNLPYVFRPPSELDNKPISPAVLLCVGAAAGFLSGLMGAVGVLFNRFYLKYGLSKQQIVATRAMNEVLVHIVKLAAYSYMGLMSAKALMAGAVVGVAALLASNALKPLLRRLPRAAFAKIGYGAMAVSGVVLLGSAAKQVVARDHIRVDYAPVVEGAEAKLQWRNSQLSLEFVYDEGIELELGVPMAELTHAQMKTVEAQDPGATERFAEAVYQIGRSYHEVYYVRDGRVLKQIELDASGGLLESTAAPSADR